MGISQKVNNVVEQIQDGVKSSSRSLFAITMKVMTAFMIGLTIALIGQESMGYGTVLFVFMMVVVGGAVYRLIRGWGIGGTLVFDLICVLVAMLLRMYILLAP